MKKRIYSIVIFMIAMIFMLGGCSKKTENEVQKETIAFNTLENQLFSYFSLELNQEEFAHELAEGSKFTITPHFDFPDSIQIQYYKYEVQVPDHIEPLKQSVYESEFDATSSKEAETLQFVLKQSANNEKLVFTNIEVLSKDGKVYTADDCTIEITNQPHLLYHRVEQDYYCELKEEASNYATKTYIPFEKYEQMKVAQKNYAIKDQLGNISIYDLYTGKIQMLFSNVSDNLKCIGNSEVTGFVISDGSFSFTYEGYYLLSKHEMIASKDNQSFIEIVDWYSDQPTFITVYQYNEKEQHYEIVKAVDEYGNVIDLVKDGYLTQYYYSYKLSDWDYVEDTNFYYHEYFTEDDERRIIIYNKDNQFLYDSAVISNSDFTLQMNNQGTLMIATQDPGTDQYFIYSIVEDGSAFAVSKNYEKAFFIDQYMIVAEEDLVLRILDTDFNEVANFGKVDVSKIELYQTHVASVNGKPLAIHIAVYNPELTPEDYLKEHPNQYYGEFLADDYIYYLDDKTTEHSITYLISGNEKPVVYLYPKDDNTPVSVTFDHPDLLTTTYPKYQNSWKVVANTNGDLYDQDGKYYYGLYFEEEANYPVDFNEGFYVTKDNAIEFLEEKLTMIGLNPRERNEMIMYWLPVLENNGQSIVKFEFTNERQAFNGIHIDPKPDSMLRVLIHIQKVNEKVDIKPQYLPHFERNGFSVVEWGGRKH